MFMSCINTNERHKALIAAAQNLLETIDRYEAKDINMSLIDATDNIRTYAKKGDVDGILAHATYIMDSMDKQPARYMSYDLNKVFYDFKSAVQALRI